MYVINKFKLLFIENIFLLTKIIPERHKMTSKLTKKIIHGLAPSYFDQTKFQPLNSGIYLLKNVTFQ